MFVRFIQVVEYSSRSTVDGRLRLFWDGGANNAGWNILIVRFGEHIAYVCVSFGYIASEWTAGPRVCKCSALVDVNKFSIVVPPFTLPTAKYGRSRSSLLSTLSTVSVTYFSHSGYVSRDHCD